MAEEIFVTVRDTDHETWDFFDNYHNILPLQILTVSVPGVVAAMNMGLDAAQGDIIAFTDDDAVPHPDWLSRMEKHFLLDNHLGGVGGRDFLYENGQLSSGSAEVVGELQWFGRLIGNHHIGVGDVREVDVLKGVNMGFRKTTVSSLRFDKRLRGSGAQVHLEIPFCLAIKRAGWKIIYDPLLTVDHYRSQRFDEDQRSTFNYIAKVNATHNFTFALLEHLRSWQRPIFVLWILLVGTRGHIGFIQMLRFLPNEGSIALKKCLASTEGIWLGQQTWRKG